MASLRSTALSKIQGIAPRFLPFADVATEAVPLSRLLRLSLFQVTVGMALVLLVGTLNRVMIVELSVPASLVALMIALPLVFAPFRAFIGYKSDIHTSALGWRRVPYIWKGTMLQFGGFAIMPFALLVLSGYREAADAAPWIGQSAAALAFLLVGAGVHTVQTVGLALATDLVEVEDQPKVVGLMYVMLLLGMIASALIFGWLLQDYTPGRLIRVVQGAAVVTVALNLIALWKQEPRDRARANRVETHPEFIDAWRLFVRGRTAVGLLIVIALGTMGFGMADVLLEPYGGQVLDLSVAATTRLTAVLAGGGLVGFAIASKVLLDGHDPLDVAWWGALIGVPAFALIIGSGPMGETSMFVIGTAFAGLGAGLFGHGTLTATMRSAPRAQVGLALGAWGAVQATAAGIAVALGGILRDMILTLPNADTFRPEAAYTPVFTLELALLLAAVVAIFALRRKQARLSQTMSYTCSKDGPDPYAVPSDPTPPDRRPSGGEPHDHRRLTAL
ncbi:PucC family protein [Roseicyclus mahoneyensis]|uniref:BCD family chlorophyll transporter-like MFS transporter n=1 Tax=Roseicyclus mahoneyensis TaxID=164332 RepID=A0A316GQ89_9RHOB|nr:PucC family protein [Roseicyclus mahoneyensis]PWK62571.1 BCD family chlorophyll transporter-like MFS transporter [Roseicyclus mahoneyensis]